MNYYFLDSKYHLIQKITVTTVPKPIVGSCTIQPQSGVAGQTLFTISCLNFNNDNNTENMFEYYQKNKNDETFIGKQFNNIQCILNDYV